MAGAPLYIPNGGPNPEWDPNVPWGRRLFPQVVASRAAENPDHVISISPKSADVSEGFVRITMGELNCAVDRMSWWIHSNLGKRVGNEVFAYMGTGDFRYVVVLFAAIKTGFPVLFPSPRNSLANNLHLVEAANCTAILYAPPYGSKAEELVKAAELEKQRQFKIKDQIPDWDQLRQSPSEPYPYTKTFEEAEKDEVVVIHTSGSTGNPKPYAYTNRIIAYNDAVRLLPPINGRRSADTSSTNNTTFFCGFPAFHAAGLFARMCPINYNATIVTGPPDIPPNGKMLIDIMRSVKIQHLTAPPSLIEDLVKYHSDELLANPDLKVVYYAGGPLAHWAGKLIYEKMPHVKLASTIGQTEALGFPSLEPLPGTSDYFEWYPNVGITMELVDEAEQLYELVIKRDPRLEWIQAAFIFYPELQEWRTKDLYRTHPTKKTLFQFVGRRDDVLVLSNGEKFNPVGFEQRLLKHPLISGALVVGYGRFQCALIIEPKDPAIPSEKLIEEVWPAIERENGTAPAHGQIHRQLVMKTPPPKPFPRTAKSTVMRFAANALYSEEIEGLYAAYATNRQIPPLESTEPEVVAQYVRDSVAPRLRIVSDKDDFFSSGMDSLTAVTLSNNLTAALQPFTSASYAIRPEMIYENPTVERLTEAVLELLKRKPDEQAVGDNIDISEPRKLNLMLELVSKYSTNFPNLVINVATTNGTLKSASEVKNVVVTGTTGSLGYYLVLSLLKDAHTGTIYCLNRSDQAAENFWERYQQRRDNAPIPDGKLKFVKVSFSDDLFGLSKQSFKELSDEVDIIIHNAWKVDFNHDLTTFEPHIRGLHTFISLCFSSSRRPSIYFTSSVGATILAKGWVPEIVFEDPKVSSSIGYTQSKWVCEKIIDNVHREHGFDVNVLRVGQIAGPIQDETGMWNRNEHLPLLIETSKSMGMVPELLGNSDRPIDWIPVDSLADIIIEVIYAPKPVRPSDVGAPVFNLVNPRTVSFQTLAPAIQAYFGPDTRVVPYDEWMEFLDGLDRKQVDMWKKYPALKLYAMFDGWRRRHPAEDALLGYQTERTREVSAKMRDLEAISGSMMHTWMRQWKL